MNLRSLALGGTMLAGCLVAATGPLYAANTTTITGNVAPDIGSATRLGAVPKTKQVLIAVHMALRHLEDLKGFVADVSTPHSPNYGQYLTPEAFRARFAPNAADVAATAALLTQAGMKNVNRRSGRRLCDGRGERRPVEADLWCLAILLQLPRPHVARQCRTAEHSGGPWAARSCPSRASTKPTCITITMSPLCRAR